MCMEWRRLKKSFRSWNGYFCRLSLFPDHPLGIRFNGENSINILHHCISPPRCSPQCHSQLHFTLHFTMQSPAHLTPHFYLIFHFAPALSYDTLYSSKTPSIQCTYGDKSLVLLGFVSVSHTQILRSFGVFNCQISNEYYCSISL